MARRLAKTTPSPRSKAVTLEEHILEVTDDILRLSAGLQSALPWMLNCKRPGHRGATCGERNPSRSIRHRRISRRQAPLPGCSTYIADPILVLW
nr:DUF1484 domain-containing protein [Cupriavidus necator]